MAAGDLTTLALVRSHMQIDTADTSQDTLITALISRASAAIMRYAQREFASTSASGTRAFRYSGGGIVDLSPYDLRSLTAVVLDTDESSTTTLSTSDYRLLPIPARDGVYNRIELRGYSPGLSDSNTGPRQAWRQVSVTSTTWGFAAVPPPVEEACILTVAYWIRHFSAFFSASFRDDMDTSTEGRMAIPLAAKLLIDPYRKRPSR